MIENAVAAAKIHLFFPSSLFLLAREKKNKRPRDSIFLIGWTCFFLLVGSGTESIGRNLADGNCNMCPRLAADDLLTANPNC